MDIQRIIDENNRLRSENTRIKTLITNLYNTMKEHHIITCDPQDYYRNPELFGVINPLTSDFTPQTHSYTPN